MQTLSGWTSIGYGTVRIPWIRFFERVNGDFRQKAVQAQEDIRAMSAALDDLSLKCNPTDAHRALYLLCAPPEKMSTDMLEALSNALKNIARDAVIRSGDYPRGKHSLDITIVLSELRNVGRISDFFSKVILYISAKKKQRGVESEQKRLEDAFKDIPTLL